MSSYNNTGRITAASALAQAHYNNLVKKFGTSNPDTLRYLGAGLGVATEVAEGIQEYNQNSMQITALNRSLSDINRASTVAKSNIAKQREGFLAEQKIAYTRGNVSLEGSALDVMAETVIQSMNEEQAVMDQFNQQRTALEVQKRLAEYSNRTALTRGLVNGATGIGMLYYGGK